MQQHQDLNDLYYFVQVVDHRGFAPAGRALGMPKSKLSRRIALLEERLGVRLLLRSTRKFSVTDLGQTYYQHCKAMLIEADAAQRSIEAVQAQPRGVVRLTCPITLLHELVSTMLTDYMVMYPDVTVQLEATNRRVDVIGEGMDLAIRVRTMPLEDSDLSVRMLSVHAQHLVASPILLARQNLPRTPYDLTSWPSLWLGSPEQQFIWQLEHAEQATASVPHQPHLITTDMVALRSAALAGLGIVQLPVIMIHEQIANGTLVKVLPEWGPRQEAVHAVFASRRGMLPAVRALIDHLAVEFGKVEC
ncbi:MAG: LysR family transcriptional regulator [Comamonas sp.]